MSHSILHASLIVEKHVLIYYADSCEFHETFFSLFTNEISRWRWKLGDEIGDFSSFPRIFTKGCHWASFPVEVFKPPRNVDGDGNSTDFVGDVVIRVDSICTTTKNLCQHKTSALIRMTMMNSGKHFVNFNINSPGDFLYETMLSANFHKPG